MRSYKKYNILAASPHYGNRGGAVANMPDCDIVVSEFELQISYYILPDKYPKEKYEPLIFTSYELNITTAIYNKPGFGIIWHTKVRFSIR